MVGIPSNLTWKFLINATSFMQNFVALPKRLHGEIWPKNPKIAKKKHVFEFIDLKTICKGHGTQIFFPILLL